MNSLKIFHIVTNFLGLNFYDFKISISAFLSFHIFVQCFNIFVIFYYPYFMGPETWYYGHGVYSITQIHQSILPYVLQIFFILKAFIMRNRQKELSHKLRPKFTQKIGKSERKFLIRVFVIVAIRITKYLWVPDEHSGIFNSHTAFTELTYSSNDLMFVF